MTKTFCDFCETYIPNPSFFNSWYLPVWEESTLIRGDTEIFSEKGVVPRAFCLCDALATIINRYKIERKRERF